MPNGVSLAVKVQPKSRRPGINGRAEAARGPCLRIGVNEPPEDGRANRAVCAVVAEVLGVPLSAVTVMQGQTSRDKILHIAGDTSFLIEKLETL